MHYLVFLVNRGSKSCKSIAKTKNHLKLKEVEKFSLENEEIILKFENYRFILGGKMTTPRKALKEKERDGRKREC